MPRNKRISVTVNQGDGDELDYKRLIDELRKSRRKGNIYSGRSESETVKLLLDRILPREHRRFVGSARRK
ncbi:MAG: hypothetical protein WB760_06235 [Xanthobacteraceae bacterium]